MAFVSPKVVLQVLAGVLGVFAIAMLTSPVGFMSQYNVDYSTWKLDGKMLLTSLVQGWGMNNFMLLIACVSAARVGSEGTQGRMCLAFGCSYVFGIVMMLLGWNESLAFCGGKPAGLYFNLVLMGGFAIACFGGASFDLKKSTLSKPIYWASIATCAMFICYLMVMLFSPESLLGAYGFSLEGDAQTLILYMMQYGMVNPTFQMILVFMATFFSDDVGHQYIFNRGLSIFLALNFLNCCVSGAWWKTSGYDASGSAMTQNSFLMLILFVVSFHANAQYDGAIKVMQMQIQYDEANKEAIEANTAKGRESPLLAGAQIA